MRLEEVPQDNIETLGAVKKLLYAVDAQGSYSGVHTSGWSAEEAALNFVLDENEEMAKEVAAQVARGEASPLAYFMYKRHLDVTDLAQAVGLFTFVVKRHFKPKHFSRLSSAVLERYATVLRITLSELTNFKGLS